MADVKRTSLFLDRDKVRTAQRILQTKNTTDTIHAALDAIAERREWKDLFDAIDAGELGEWMSADEEADIEEARLRRLGIDDEEIIRLHRENILSNAKRE
jgi:hypothetical protein